MDKPARVSLSLSLSLSLSSHPRKSTASDSFSFPTTRACIKFSEASAERKPPFVCIKIQASVYGFKRARGELSLIARNCAVWSKENSENVDRRSWYLAHVRERKCTQDRDEGNQTDEIRTLISQQLAPGSIIQREPEANDWKTPELNSQRSAHEANFRSTTRVLRCLAAVVIRQEVRVAWSRFASPVACRSMNNFAGRLAG